MAGADGWRVIDGNAERYRRYVVPADSNYHDPGTGPVRPRAPHSLAPSLLNGHKLARRGSHFGPRPPTLLPAPSPAPPAHATRSHTHTAAHGHSRPFTPTAARCTEATQSASIGHRMRARVCDSHGAGPSLASLVRPPTRACPPRGLPAPACASTLLLACSLCLAPPTRSRAASQPTRTRTHTPRQMPTQGLQVVSAACDTRRHNKHAMPWPTTTSSLVVSVRALAASDHRLLTPTSMAASPGHFAVRS